MLGGHDLKESMEARLDASLLPNRGMAQGESKDSHYLVLEPREAGGSLPPPICKSSSLEFFKKQGVIAY